MERSLVDIATNTTPDTGAIKLDYIDSLRGIAILGVIAVHALLVVGTTEHMPPLFVALVANGAWGVRLFFIASAFTLCLSGNNRKKYERRPKLNFFLRRWFRIAPIYYLGLIGYSAWTYFSTLRIPALSNVVLEVFFLHGLTPNTINGIVPGGWSITVEMCFYCSIPLLIRYVTSLTRAMWFLLGSMLVNALFGYILYKHPFTADLHTWNLFLALYLPKQMPVFALGFVLYFIVRQSVPVKPGVLLAFALLIIFASGIKFILSQAPIGFVLLPEDFTMPLGLMLFALVLSMRPYRFFVNRFTRKVGELSFSLYLVHFGVLFIMHWRSLENSIEPYNTSRALLNFGVVV